MRRGILVGLTLLAAATGAPGHAGLRTVRGLELDPMQEEAVERAVEGAARRLGGAGCRAILTDFTAVDGTPLRDRLVALDVGAEDYVSWIVFADGSHRQACQREDVLAVTAPGSRVVYVCGRRFLDLARRGDGRADLVILHEALHTLGLGENPPDSLAITRRVAQRCGSGR
jgi:hypothetical protein